MVKIALAKAGVIVMLEAAVLLMPASHRDWFTYGLLLFGIVNVLLDLPGTGVVRRVAVVTTFGILVWQDRAAAFWMTLFAWLLWPPAFMVAWSLARHSGASENPGSAPENASGRGARIGVSAIIVAVAIPSIAARVLSAHCNRRRLQGRNRRIIRFFVAAG